MGNEPSSENLQEIKLYRASESFKNNFWNNPWRKTYRLSEYAIIGKMVLWKIQGTVCLI